MKKLFMIIFIPVLFILGTPALIATLMYDGTGSEHLPVELYTDEYDAMTMLFEELDTSISEVEAGTTTDLEFNLNRAIYEAILETNPDYAPGDDCVTDEQCYVFADAQEIEGFNIAYRLVGAWVSFYAPESVGDYGKFVFNVFAEIDLNEGLTYKTVLEVHFLFDDNEDNYYLEFDKIQMGRLPLPKSIFTTIINAVQNQADIDLEAEIENADLPIGEFDLSTISYTLPKDEILAEVNSSDDSNDVGTLLAQELLSIVFDNQLITFELRDEQFVLTAGVSQFRSDDLPTEGYIDGVPAYLYDLHDQEVVGEEIVYGDYNPTLFDPEEYLTDVFTQYIFNSALVDGGFEIEEEIFNKLIYSGAEGFANTRQTQAIPVSQTEDKDIELGLKAIWFEFEENDIFAHALFTIGGIDSMLVIRAEEVSAATTTSELQFTFVEITIGRDALEDSSEYLEITDLEVFKQVFADLGDVQFGEFNADGDLIISTERLSGLMQDGTEAGAVEVNGIHLQENGIVLDVVAGSTELQQTLEDFQTALNDVMEDPELLTDLEELLNTEDGGAEQGVYDSVVDLQTTLADPEEEVTPEQVEELFENFDELDPETQEDFLETIGGLIDPTLLEDYGNLFGSFDQTVEEE